MTAKTLEKVPVNIGGFVHPVAESVYSVEDIATSVAIFPNSGDLGAHYDQISVAAGKKSDLISNHVSAVLYAVAPVIDQRVFGICRRDDGRRHECGEALPGPFVLPRQLLAARESPQPDFYLYGQVLHRLAVPGQLEPRGRSDQHRLGHL